MSFHHRCHVSHCMVLHEQMQCIAATKLIWIAVVLNGTIKASGPLKMVGRDS